MASDLALGARIRALRKRRGMTQEQLAGLIERSVDAVSQIERGVNLPGFQTLQRIASALEASLNDLNSPAVEEPTSRASLYDELLRLGRALDDDRLLIAVEQVRALARKTGHNA
jgi:transcriptional regulator with XRE-family HTH domain